MSYEGRIEYLCSRGHMTVCDVWDDIFDEKTHQQCDQCGEYFVFRNSIDETNGQDPETGLCPGEIMYEIEEAAIYERCNLGHLHEMSPTRFKIPEKNLFYGDKNR